VSALQPIWGRDVAIACARVRGERAGVSFVAESGATIRRRSLRRAQRGKPSNIKIVYRLARCFIQDNRDYRG
jgi:hypothetical protein